MCYAVEPHGIENAEEDSQSGPGIMHASVLIAVPARDDKKAEVYQFPEEKLRFVVPRAQSKDTGEWYAAGGLAINNRLPPPLRCNRCEIHTDGCRDGHGCQACTRF